MKKLIITTTLFIAAFSICVRAQAVKVNTKVNVKYQNGNHFGENHVPGIWLAYIEDEKLYLEFTGENWNSSRTVLMSEIKGPLPMGTDGSFSLTRDAGTVNFKGIFEGGKGHGFYKFAENAAYKTYLEQKGFKDIDEELMIHIFFTDISKSYFDFLKTNGYTDIKSEELKDLAYQNLNQKVMADYLNLFKTEGYGHQTLGKIIELKEHGVNAKFVSGFHEIGFKNIPLDRVLALRDHGVTPAYITEFLKMGYKDITLEKAKTLRDHGVTLNFIGSMYELGYKNISLEKARELRDHGVTPEFIKSIQALGFKDISLDKAQELRDHGVTASYIKRLKENGNNPRSLDDYIRLKDTGFKQ